MQLRKYVILSTILTGLFTLTLSHGHSSEGQVEEHAGSFLSRLMIDTVSIDPELNSRAINYICDMPNFIGKREMIKLFTAEPGAEIDNALLTRAFQTLQVYHSHNPTSLDMVLVIQDVIIGQLMNSIHELRNRNR